MRIVAGKYGSRPLKTLSGDATRPTSDKVKGAVFSSLGGRFVGGRFLDYYSGSGAMALEAISRGMDQAVCVDQSHAACRIIRENIQTLGVQDQCMVLQQDIFHAIDQLTEPFDLVYIDPPYARQRNEELIKELDRMHLIKGQGILVVESADGDDLPDTINDIYKYKEKKYRNTKITYYRKGD